MSADKFEEWWDAPKEPLPYGAGKERYRECWLASRKAALEECMAHADAIAHLIEDGTNDSVWLAAVKSYRAWRAKQ